MTSIVSRRAHRIGELYPVSLFFGLFFLAILSSCGTTPGQGGPGAGADTVATADGAPAADTPGAADSAADAVVADTSPASDAQAADDSLADAGCSPATCKGQCLPATGQCVECTLDSHCGKNLVCVANQCTASSTCPVGGTKCQDPGVVLTCTDGKTWQSSVCPKGTLCTAGTCKATLCSPGQPICSGGKAGPCNATGTGIDNPQDCAASGKFCNAGTCTDTMCVPGQLYCDGNSMSLCNQAGTGPDKQMDCAQMGGICLDGQCQESPCMGGALGCQGSQVVQCNGPTVQVIQDCGATNEACDQGVCKAKVCQPFEQLCVNDTTMKTCNPSGTAWEPDLDCAMMMPNAICANNQCVELPCKGPGQLGCVGKNVVECNGAQVKTVQDCGLTNLVCVAGACAQPICTPGKTECDGDDMAICNADGSGYDAKLPCAMMGMTCFDGQCQKAPCKPGDLGCDGDKVVQCSGALPQVLQDCAAIGQVCDKAACVLPSCAPGEALCDGSKVMYCNGKGTGYEVGEDCSQMGGSCVNGQCVAMPCGPGGLGCVGSDVVQCDAAGKSFVTVQACGDAGGTCANGACASPICAPAFGECNGTVAQMCNDTGSAFGKTTDCAAKGQSCSAGTCTNLSCAPGLSGCQGASQMTCPASGAGWQAKACPAGQVCLGSSCLQPTCSLPATMPSQAIRLMLWGPLGTDQACDLNGDGAPDNAAKSSGLAIAAVFPQPGATTSVVVAATNGWATDGTAFDVQLLIAQAAAGQTCSATATASSCKVTVDPLNYDLPGKVGTCAAKGILAQAKVAGTKFTAGGTSSVAYLPVGPAPIAKLVTVKMARMVGDTVPGPGWKGLTKGRFCGAIDKNELVASIDAINPLWLQGMGISAADLSNSIAKSLTPDIDANNDGVKESVSFVLRYVGAPVELGGITP